MLRERQCLIAQSGVKRRQQAQMELLVLSPTSPKRKKRVKLLVILLCLALYNAMYCSPPGSSVHDFSRQEYWSEEPFLSPGDLPDPGIEARSPALQVDSLPI